MSVCRLTCEGVNFPFDLYVERFEAPMNAAESIKSGQTQEGIHYFPHKAYMQELAMDVIFPSDEKYQQFQDFVRASHKWAVRTVQNPEVVIYWPERGMDNWSGLIINFSAGVTRFEFAPRATIRIKLVDSLLSEKTWAASMGDDFSKFFETDIGYDPEDDIITPPTQENPTQGGDTPAPAPAPRPPIPPLNGGRPWENPPPPTRLPIPNGDWRR